MPRDSRDLKVFITPPEGGCDEERLLKALEMLVPEKDFIDYFQRQRSDRHAGPSADSNPHKNHV